MNSEDDFESRLERLGQATLSSREASALDAQRAAVAAGHFKRGRSTSARLPAGFAMAVVLFGGVAFAAGITSARPVGSPRITPSQLLPVSPSTGTLVPPVARTVPAHLEPLAHGERLNLSSIKMVTGTTGWSAYVRIASSGLSYDEQTNVLRTIDAGRTWADVTPPAGRARILDSFFLDSSRAWILVGDAVISGQPETATVWRTTDAGATWRSSGPVSPPDFGGRGGHIAFIDALHGWIDSPGAPGQETQWQGLEIDTTADGGATWQRRQVTEADNLAPSNVPVVPGPIPLACGKRGVTFRDRLTGWVAGGCGSGVVFYRTDDGGATWRVQPLRSPAGGPLDLKACGGFAAGCGVDPPRFTSRQDATMILRYRQGSGDALLSTHDGGATWTGRDIPGLPNDGYLDVTYFLDRSHGWKSVIERGLTSSSGTTRVGRTVDGGATWTDDFSAAGIGSMVFDFVSPSTGFGIFGTTGSTPTTSLFRTDDGGRTWASVDPRFA